MAEDAGSVYSEVRLKLDNLTHDIMTVSKKFQTLGQSMIAGVNRPSEQVRKSIEDLTAKIKGNSQALAEMTQGKNTKEYYKELTKAIKDAEKANQAETRAALQGEKEKAQALEKEITHWGKLKAAMESKQAALQGGEEAARMAAITKLSADYANELERINHIYKTGIVSEQEKARMIQSAQRKELEGLAQLEREYKGFGKEQEKIKQRIKEQAAAYKEVEAAAKKAGKGSGLQAAFNFAGIHTALTAIVDGVKAAAKAAVQFAKDGIKAYQDQEAASARLSAVLKSTGADAWTNLDLLQDMASKQSAAMGKSTKEIQEMQAVLLGFTSITGDVFEETSEGLINMAAVMGGDLVSAANQFGKALDTPAESLSALTRYGFKFTEQQIAEIEALEKAGKHAEAQRIILKSMKTAFGDAAAAVNKAALSQNNFETAIRNLKTAAGKPLEEAIRPLRNFFTDLINGAAGAVQKTNDTKDALQRLSENNYAPGLEGQIKQQKDFILQYQKEIDDLRQISGKNLANNGMPSAAAQERIDQLKNLINLNEEDIRLLEERQKAEHDANAKKAANAVIEENNKAEAETKAAEAQAKAEQEHAARMEAIKDLEISYEQAIAQAKRERTQAEQEAGDDAEALAAARAQYAQAEANALQSEIDGLHSLSIQWHIRGENDAEAERGIKNRLGLQEGEIANARSMADITANQAEIETALVAVDEEYNTALEQARVQREAGLITAEQLERAQADAAEERLRKLQDMEIQYRNTAGAAELLERVRSAMGGAQESSAKERGEAENSEKIVELTKQYNDELVEVEHEKENIRRENEKELDYQRRLIDNEKEWALAALDGLDETSKEYKDLVKLIEQVAEEKKKLLGDDDGGGGKKSFLAVTRDDAVQMMDSTKSILSAAADWAIAETQRQADEHRKIKEKAYKYDMERIEEEKNERLIAAGFEVANNEASLEAQLEAAKLTGDEILIYQAERALEKQRIEDEAAAKEKEITDKLEHDKAEIAYKAELQQWNWNMSMAAVNAAAAIMKIWAEVWKGDFGAATLALSGAAATVAGIQAAAMWDAKPDPPTFATGGIVPGTNYSGDNVLVRANSREAILTEEQQRNFMDMANGKGGGGGTNATIIVMMDTREIARSTINLVNDGFYTIKMRAIR